MSEYDSNNIEKIRKHAAPFCHFEGISHLLLSSFSLYLLFIKSELREALAIRVGNHPDQT